MFVMFITYIPPWKIADFGRIRLQSDMNRRQFFRELM